MTLLPMYTAMWEWKAATKDERQVEAEYAWLADALRSRAEGRRAAESSRPEKPALRKLLTSWGHAQA